MTAKESEFILAMLTPEYDDFVAAFMMEVPEFDRTNKEANDALFNIYEALKESATAQITEKLTTRQELGL